MYFIFFYLLVINTDDVQQQDILLDVCVFDGMFCGCWLLFCGREVRNR